MTPAPPRTREAARAAAHQPDAGPTGFDDHLATRLLHQRIVVLGAEVDDAIANRLCAQILLLSAEDPRRDIALYINSPGGSVSAALAIHDVMQLISNDVSTLAMGLAASAAQFLLCAGAPGKRFALEHARILMHQPSGGLGGTAVDIAIQAQNMAHVKATMQGLIATHSGQTVETIERDSDRDRWFTAHEALEYGLIDRVVTHVEDVRPDGPEHKVGL